jgi:PTS system nitrogen regulatory IIA component
MKESKTSDSTAEVNAVVRNGPSLEGLGELIQRGGVIYNLPGNSVREILEALVSKVCVPLAITGQDLLQAILEREALMSTSIGRGIALPHPRNPLITNSEEQFVSLAFLDNPVDWKALDNKPVDTLLLIVSSSAKSHLKTLSSITFFCREEGFLRLLKEKVPQETLIRYIKDTEQKW